MRKNTVGLSTPKKGDPDAETMYALAKDAKVIVYGRDAKLKDLPKDSQVSINGQRSGHKPVRRRSL